MLLSFCLCWRLFLCRICRENCRRSAPGGNPVWNPLFPDCTEWGRGGLLSAGQSVVAERRRESGCNQSVAKGSNTESFEWGKSVNGCSQTAGNAPAGHDNSGVYGVETGRKLCANGWADTFCTGAYRLYPCGVGRYRSKSWLMPIKGGTEGFSVPPYLLCVCCGVGCGESLSPVSFWNAYGPVDFLWKFNAHIDFFSGQAVVRYVYACERRRMRNTEKGS